MPSELQELIDDLADLMGAPAILEDRDQRTVAHSAHHEPIDDLRRQSILRHRADPGALAWFRQFGIFRSTEPVRIPRRPDNRTLGRLCIPVRHRGRLLGFLWFIDDDDRIGAAQMASASVAIRRLSALLYDEEMSRRLADRVVARLLSPWEELRRSAASQLVEEGRLPADAPVLTVVARPLGMPAREARECVGQALSDLAFEPAPGAAEALRLVRDDHAVLLVRTPSLDEDEPGRAMADAVGRALRRRLAGRAPDREADRGSERGSEPSTATPRVVVGIGEPQARPVRTVVSYRQARLSAQVAARVPSVGDVCRWRELGVFRVLAQLPSDEVAEAAVDPRVASLFQVANPDLVRTLETYLDSGCDAKATAERLYLHRATLYYRLQKAERLTGMNLRDGGDRLAVHLSLKLGRLTGLHPDHC